MAESGGQKEYGEIETGDGQTIIYDRQNPDAWVQSTVAIPQDDMS